MSNHTYHLEEGQIYKDGIVLFKIEKLEPITRYCTKVYFSFCGANFLSDWLFDAIESDLIDGIESGSIKLVEG